MRLVLAALISIFLPLGQHSGGGAIVSPSNLTLPQIIGLDTVGSSVYADTGTWDGSTSTKSCSWHMLDNHGGVLSTSCGSSASPALTLTSGMVSFCSGSTDSECGRLQVDVTAANGAGNSTALSDFVGPVETSLPTLPAAGAGPAPTSLPVYPANFLENGHAVYPGCAVPPAAPTFTTGAHVWYFDSVNGSSSNTGHLGSPFKDIAAIFNTTTGYGATPLFGHSIAPGDTIYIEPDPSGASVGNFQGASATLPVGAYSTSDGTTTGTIVWTWIAKDPAAATNPVIGRYHQATSAGFVYQNINVEQISSPVASNGAPMATIDGGVANPTHDMVYEGMSLTSWIGHSNDPREPSAYPNSGGASDGTIQTASPYVFGTIDPEDPPSVAVVASAANQTQIFFQSTFTAQFAIGDYVWSPGYYYQTGWSPSTAAPQNTGIPNGSIIQDIQGSTAIVMGGSVASGPPAFGVTLNQAWLATNTFHLWVGCQEPSTFCPTGTSLVWADEGTAFFTIAACDTTANALTGCSQVPIECDPRIPPAAACTGSPTWTGTTRALTGAASNDYATFTKRMRIVPSGYWSHLDWDYAQSGFGINGNVVGTSNDIEGTQCISLKNNTIRYVNTAIQHNLNVNMVDYGNWVKYRAQDNIQVLSSHRIIIADNDSAEVSFDRGHPDEIQFAQNGASSDNNAQFYGSAVVGNEFYTSTDTTDQFAGFTQGIGVTDQVYSDSYMADNINFASANASGIAGEFNVDVQNDSLFDYNAVSGQLKVVSGNKGNQNVAANSMLQNNVTNSILRNINVPGVNTGLRQATGAGAVATTCIDNSPIAGEMTVTAKVAGPVTLVAGNAYSLLGFAAPNAGYIGNYTALAGTNSTTVVGQRVATCPNATATSEGTSGITLPSCSFDLNTVSGNLVISTLDLINGTQANGSSTYCNTSDTVVNGASSGIYPDFNGWSPTDYRSGTANPLFTDYSPVPPAALPAPGGDRLTPNTCLRNEYNVGTCSPGAVGRLDLRLNASFTPTPTSGIIGNIANEQSIPTSGAIGDAYILASPAICANGNPGCGTTGSPGACGTNGANFYANCIFPPGIYKRCATASTFVAPCTTTVGSATMTGYGASASPSFVSGAIPFTPGAIGAGTFLGAQKPPTNHARKTWSNPPNIGAY